MCFLVKFPLLFKLHIKHLDRQKLKEKKQLKRNFQLHRILENEFVMSENVT